MHFFSETMCYNVALLPRWALPRGIPTLYLHQPEGWQYYCCFYRVAETKAEHNVLPTGFPTETNRFPSNVERWIERGFVTLTSPDCNLIADQLFVFLLHSNLMPTALFPFLSVGFADRIWVRLKESMRRYVHTQAGKESHLISYLNQIYIYYQNRTYIRFT